jgi:DNA processing protein
MGLAACAQGGDPHLAKLVREQGAVEVWEFLRSGKGSTSLARRASHVEVSSLEQQTHDCGARFLIPGDEEWPAGLLDLSWSEPVGDMGGEPLGLWVQGPVKLSELGAGVGVVGSRASTSYGEFVASQWAGGLAEQGYAVVSGGAYGIDASAHRGALACGGVTVAVMAGGLHQYYPAGNSALIQRIAEKGAVISENPPTVPPSRSRFLVRNRLIAALAKATLIVEGAMRSGAQNTVSWALSMQRLVLAVPGPVTSAMSVTPHRLIRQGQATLVSSVEEILEEMKPVNTDIADFERTQPTLFDSLTDHQKTVFEALPARQGMSVDELVLVTGDSVMNLQVCLTELFTMGLVKQSDAGHWLAIPRPKNPEVSLLGVTHPQPPF